MKKIFLLAVLLVSLVSIGQVTGPKLTYKAVGYTLSAPTHATTDTITNAVVKSQFAIIGGSNVHVTFQPTFTKISGTVAGTAQLQGSVDGVTYNNVGSAYTLTDVASQTTSFIVTPSTYQYYKLLITPSGTQSTKVQTPVLIRTY